MITRASDSVAPRMRSFESRDSGGEACCGMALRIICVTGERGGIMMLMPECRRAMARKQPQRPV